MRRPHQPMFVLSQDRRDKVRMPWTWLITKSGKCDRPEPSSWLYHARKIMIIFRITQTGFPALEVGPIAVRSNV